MASNAAARAPLERVDVGPLSLSFSPSLPTLFLRTADTPVAREFSFADAAKLRDILVTWLGFPADAAYAEQIREEELEDAAIAERSGIDMQGFATDANNEPALTVAELEVLRGIATAAHVHKARPARDAQETEHRLLGMGLLRKAAGHWKLTPRGMQKLAGAA